MPEKIIYPRKLYDTERAPRRGRVDRAWLGQTFKSVFGGQRSGPRLPAALLAKIDDPTKTLAHFNLRAWEYGNWLEQDDRWQYYTGAIAGFHDLAKAIGFEREQIGLGGLVSVAFGARGRSSAKAHFEPDTYAINLTRYSRDQASEGDLKFLDPGSGYGSLGHEWAHALDYYLGSFREPNKQIKFASGSIKAMAAKNPPPMSKSTRKAFELMRAIVYKKSGGGYERSDFYERILKIADAPGDGKGDYFVRPQEIFARSFEVHLHYEGEKKGLKNPYLYKNKYVDKVYPTRQEWESWRPKMRALLATAQELVPGDQSAAKSFFK